MQIITTCSSYQVCTGSDNETVSVIKMESLPCNLEEKLEKSHIMSWQQVGKIMKGMVSGVEYLHKEGYAHCDLAKRNILVAEDNTAKLCGFEDASPIQYDDKMYDMYTLGAILKDVIYQCENNIPRGRTLPRLDTLKECIHKLCLHDADEKTIKQIKGMYVLNNEE